MAQMKWNLLEERLPTITAKDALIVATQARICRLFIPSPQSVAPRIGKRQERKDRQEQKPS
jgi:hypothetical protein